MVTLLLSVLISNLAQRQSWEVNVPGTIEVGSEHYLLATERTVCDGFVRRALPSPDGRQLAFIRTPFDDTKVDIGAPDAGLIVGEPELMVFDVRLNRSVRVGTLPKCQWAMLENWSPQGGAAWGYLFDGEKESLFVADTKSRNVRIAQESEFRLSSTLDERTREIVMVCRNEEGPARNYCAVYSLNGEKRRTVHLDLERNVFIVAIQYSKSAGVCCQLYAKGSEPKWVQFDTVTGAFGKTVNGPANVRGTFGVRGTTEGDLKSMLVRRDGILFACGAEETEFDQRKVATLAIAPANGGVSPDESYFWVSGAWGLRIMPFRKLSAAEYEVMYAAAVKADAINRAKIIGVGMMIYSADNDDKLPTNGDWSTVIKPYLKDDSLQRDFNYMLDGQSLVDMDDPAGTVLGFIETNYGRAIVYADSHVKWQNRGG